MQGVATRVMVQNLRKFTLKRSILQLISFTTERCAVAYYIVAKQKCVSFKAHLAAVKTTPI